MGLPVVQHLGGLHPFEAVLVGVIAFGPFVVLAFVVARQRRREADPLHSGQNSGETAPAEPKPPE